MRASNEVDRMLARLKELRITEAEFARRLRESQQVLNNWKRRGSIPKKKIPKVATELGITIELLLTGQDLIKEESAAYSMAKEIESLPNDAQAIVKRMVKALKLQTTVEGE